MHFDASAVLAWVRARRALVWAALFGLCAASSHAAAFTAFESAHVRPLALSPDGQTLYVVNTPDDRLEMFSVSDQGLTPAGSVSVGLEPVAVAVPSGLDRQQPARV